MSSDVVIRAERLGKKYVIGHQSAADRQGTFRDMLVTNMRGWGRSAREMMRGQAIIAGDETEEFWALKDVDSEIKRGEVVGIIGRNGAGKSTLLKILSRITEPTEGRVTIDGRVASLLEVGTGFHAELSGRENIYLNGAILGMSRAEIRRKFDEIIDFAGVEKFIDTPVKRYSSGMYVRLAFSVAAHLEPEILIVDEVLAVGDADFQKKCLGKMEDVAGHGRTVLLVSHNMASISSLCKQAMWMDSGTVRRFGHPSDVIVDYSRSQSTSSDRQELQAGDHLVRLRDYGITSAEGEPTIETHILEAATIWMEYGVEAGATGRFYPNFHFYRADGTCAFVSCSPVPAESAGVHRAECHLPANFLNDGCYVVHLAVSSFEAGTHVHFNKLNALVFSVVDPLTMVPTRSPGYVGPFPGSVRPLMNWVNQPVDEGLRKPAPHGELAR